METSVERPAADEARCPATIFKIVPTRSSGSWRSFGSLGRDDVGHDGLQRDQAQTERVGRLLKMHANSAKRSRRSTGTLPPPSACRSVTTGDTICDEKQPIVLEKMQFPDPVNALAIEPKTKADQEKLDQPRETARPNPTFSCRAEPRPDRSSSPAWASSTSRSSSTRLPDASSASRRASGGPQVAYKETLTQAADGEGRYIRQTGGHGRSGHVKTRVAPRKPGEGFEFVNEIVGGAIPREYIKPVEEGVTEAMSAGVLAGYPVDDVSVTLKDGSFHEVDSSDLAFKIAGSMAFKDAAKKATPVLLEPIMRVEVVVPEEYMGDVIGDLTGRRGRIVSMEARGGTQIVNARVPLSEMFGYATDLRSRTQGRATYYDALRPVRAGAAERLR